MRLMTWADPTGWLLLRRLVVGVLSRRVVGDVDDVADLRNLPLHCHRNALRQRHLGEAAALTASTESQVCSVVLDGDELSSPAMRGDARIDLLLEHPDD